MVFTTLDVSLTPNVQQTIVDNGGMEIWQRGTTFSNPASESGYTADRWLTQYNGSPTFTISQESVNVDTGNFSMKLNITAAGGAGYFIVFQNIENYLFLQGKTVTLSARVKSNAPISLMLYDGTGNEHAGTAHPADGNWHTLFVTYTFATGGTKAWLGIGWDNTISPPTAAPSVSTTYIDSVVTAIGPNIPTFTPLHPMIDLARCQRYYETGQTQEVRVVLRPGVGGGDQVWIFTPFEVQKRTTPTVTFSSVAVTLSQTGGQTGGDSADTPNWTISTSQIYVGGMSVEPQRSTDGGFAAALFVYTWTAAADL